MRPDARPSASARCAASPRAAMALPAGDSGSIENSLSGSNRPATPLAGLLGSGDSGGSAWMKTKAGWLLVGVNSSGTGEAKYGETSWFCRVSSHRDWIASIFPDAHFSPP